MIKTGFRLILLSICFFISQIAFSQNTFNSEEELKKQAAKYFADEDFAQAYPLYTQLLSNYPKDPNYNYRCGTSMLYATSDKERPLTFLQYAVKAKDIEKEAFYYLGKAYHLNYRFDDAIRAYQQFAKSASKAQMQKFEVTRQIEMCNNGKHLLRSLKDVSVINNTELDRKEFYRSYDLSSLGGKLLVKPDDFKSSADKKKKDNSIVYLSQTNNLIFYASYGDDAKNGKDIYTIKRLPGGEWSKAQPVSASINTPFDEDYPFLHPDGKTLYFCSKGHNSMGGFDIFKTEYNESANSWSTPENLDFPINTPDDDILFVPDSAEKSAFLASSRFSPEGTIAVYQIKIDRRPVDVIAISGLVAKVKEGQGSTRITIKEVSSGDLVGVYDIGTLNPKYFFSVPNTNTKYVYSVETGGFETQSDIVSFAVQQEFKPVRQLISYEKETGKLEIKNYYDDAVSDTSYLLALELIKQKAKMDVNYDPNKVTSTEVLASKDSEKTETETANTEEKNTTKGVSNEDLIKMAYDDAKETAQEAKTLKNQADAALMIANNKNEIAQSKLKEAEDVQAKLNAATNEVEKKQLQDEYTKTKSEAEHLSNETVGAFNFAKRIENNADLKKEEAALSLDYAKELEKSTKSTNNKESLTKLEDLQKKLDELDQKQTNTDLAFNNLKLDAENKQKEADKSKQNEDRLKQELIDIDKDVASQKAEQERIKNEQLKTAIAEQIKELEQDKIDKKKELELATVKTEKLQTEANKLKNEASAVENVLGQIKSSASTETNIAAVDKSKLENNVSDLEKNIESNNAFVVNTKTDTSSNQTVAVNTNKTEEIKNVEVSKEEIKKAEKVVQSINTAVATKETTFNKEIKTVSTEKDVATKEEKKAEVYTNWAKSLEQDLETAKTEKEKITDATAKQKVEEKITSLETQIEEKKQLAQKSTDTAEQLKSTVASNNSQQTINITLTEATKQNETYTTKISATEKTTDAVTREEQKSKLYEEWASTLSKKADEAKKELVNVKDETAKKELETKIAEIEKQVLEKQAFAKQSADNVSKAKEAQLASANQTKVDTNSSVQNTNITAAGNEVKAVKQVNDNLAQEKNNYEQQLSSIETKNVVANKDSAKAATYNQWAESINKQIEVLDKESAKASTTDADNRVIQDKIDELKKEYDDKKQLASQSTALASNSTKTNTSAENLNTSMQTVEPFVSNYKFSDSETESKFSNEVNKQQQALSEIAASDKKKEEAQQITNTQEKEKAIADAEQLKQNAVVNYNQSSSEIAAITQTEYKNNKTRIDNYKIQESIDNASKQEVNQAKDLKTEAEKLFTDAASARKSAEANNDVAQKNKELISALKNESLALEKQKKADEIYKKYLAIDVAENTNQNKTENNVSILDNGNNNTTENKTTQESSNKNVLESYTTLKQETETAWNESQSQYTLAKEFSVKSEEKNKTVQVLKASAEVMNEGTKKQETIQRIAFVENQAADDKAKSDSLTQLAKNNETTATNKKAEAEKLLQGLDKQETENIVSKAGEIKLIRLSQQDTFVDNTNVQLNNNTITTENNTAANNSTTEKNTDNTATPENNTAVNTAKEIKVTKLSASTVILEPSEKFETSPTPVYSAAKPIPVDEKLPEGLVYKVQIGAFKNPIPQDLFKGMNPVTGETTPQGYIRYTAGLFKKIETANTVKNEIRSIGYPDAFVVAFLNGKRISMNQAALIQNGQNTVATNETTVNNTTNKNTQETTTNTNAVVNNTTNNNQTNTNTSTENTVTNTTTTNETANQIAEAKSVEVVKGLFYTVQVGVYNRPVTSAQLFGIQPLNTESMNDGRIRYTSGIYNSIENATQAKNTIINIGVKDAFIVAYLDGKRISLAEARNLATSNQAVESPDLNKLPTTSNQTQTNTQTTETKPIAENVIPAESQKVIYRVQVGVYRGAISQKSIIILKSVTQDNVVSRNVGDLNVYSIGELNDYESANKLKADIVAAGITDAFVVAFQNGTKISLQKARELSGK